MEGWLGCKIDANGVALAVDAATDRSLLPDGRAPDAEPPDGDAGLFDVAPDAPATCPGQISCGTSRCVDRDASACIEGCPTAPTMCGEGTGSCVADCESECAGTVGCYTCPNNPDSGKREAGTCEPAASAYCIGAAVYPHCFCNTNLASACPGQNQACDGQLCVSCGETATQGLLCKNGRRCDEVNHACRLP